MTSTDDRTDPAPDLGELERELAWFARLLDSRLRGYFRPGDASADVGAAVSARADTDPPPPPPDLSDSRSVYARFVAAQAPDAVSRTALLLALVPVLRPQLLDVFFTRNATFDRRFAEFGGVPGEGGFPPTLETLAFVLGGAALAARAQAAALLDPAHPLRQGDALRVDPAGPDAAPLHARLQIAGDLATQFLTGRRPAPALGADFPARRIVSSLDWDDLVLPPATLARLRQVEHFIRHGDTLLHDWGLAARVRPGMRVLFHGPPGTGKSLAATLLGRLGGREVFRIDLSLLVSKYIGETEKNLARVFDRAQQRGWILFFDEADALFGKRGETQHAHDRYASQEVAYLLQRIETFDGIAVLASNLRENIDPAFARRFELVVYFPLPRPAERLLLWQQAWPSRLARRGDIDLDRIAHDHALSGGAILNVIRELSLESIAADGTPVTRPQLLESITRELAKDGRHS